MIRRIALSAALLGPGVLALACGSSRSNDVEFHFTPNPSTPGVVDGGDGRIYFYLNASATCEASSADTVDAAVEIEGSEGFERWLEGIGFASRRKLRISDTLYAYEIRVPLGSVSDAMALIGKQRGVRGAGPHVVYRNDLLLTGTALATAEARFGCSALR